MSGEPVKERRFATVESVLVVKKQIERQLLKYVSKQEAMQSLREKEKIHPDVTKLVWEKLEQGNKDFFEAYNARVIIQKQISNFNKILESQARILYNTCKDGVDSAPLSFGSFAGGHHDAHMQSMNRAEICPQHLNSVPSQNCSDVPFIDPMGLADSKLWEKTNILDSPATFPIPEDNVSNFFGYEHNGIFENSGGNLFSQFKDIYNTTRYLEYDGNGVGGAGGFGHG